MTFQGSRFFLQLLLISLMSILSGCISSSFTVERPFEEYISGIKKGVTSRTDLFAALGPPATIAANPNEIILPFNLPKTIDAEGAFKIISERNNLTDTHSVYFYYYFEVHEGSIPFIGTDLFFSQQWLHSLWVLVESDSGLVIDFLKQKKDAYPEKRSQFQKQWRDYSMRKNNTNYDNLNIDDHNLPE